MKGSIDSFAAYEELALVYQLHLMDLAEKSPDRALKVLARIEAFHRKTAEKWRDRPVQPGLADAQLTVASAFFDAGRPAEQSLHVSEVITLDSPLMGVDADKKIALDAIPYEKTFTAASSL